MDGSTTIEISGDFEEILMKNTTKNVFSKDISDTLIDWDSYENGKLTKTQMKVGKAIFAIFNKLLLQTGTRTLNPFMTQFTPLERSMNQNCKYLHGFFQKQVEERIKERKVDPEVANRFDFLNLMLDAEDGLFDMYGLLSQIADIYLASTQTSTVGIQQAFTYLVKNPDALKRVRAEVDTFLQS